MAGEAADGVLKDTALDPALPPGPWAVPAGVPGGLRMVWGYPGVPGGTRPGVPTQREGHGSGGSGYGVPAKGGSSGSVRPGNTRETGVLVGRLGLVSGWQLRRLLGCASADLPGRLVRAGVLTAHVVEGPVRLPRLYGPGPGVRHSLPPWDGLAAVKQVAANQFLVRLLDLGPARGAAFGADWGPGLSVVRGGERFTVAAFREGREEEQRFAAFLALYRPGEGKTVVVAASARHLVQLSLLARERACPLRLTWDGALFHLPLARAFCRVGGDGPVPVLMSGLWADSGRGWMGNNSITEGGLT